MSSAMRVIVLASQKGGSGKTTLAGHLAVEAERQGTGPVALFDTDPQGSLSKWWNSRVKEVPVFVQSTSKRLAADLNEIRAVGYKTVIIDTPPAVSHAISEVIELADMVILPTRPSPHDLRAVGATVDIVEAKRKPLIFVLNAATARARITSEAAVALSQHGTVAPTTVHNRVDFAASMIDGRTVMETDPHGASSAEITALWTYVAARLARLEQDDAKRRHASLTQKHLNGLGRPAPAFGRRAV